ncbi:structure-specific endonuclease subunit SLX4 isoform X2 [Aricia agestis]|uniref:structure-specific endonuclease subunit SLX4 isoform X2 n=1 Tax=Aricia agestis TaxID=91739 RepID=UPI001C20AC1E|nr:structure-specific endonuclease subunit SLX4 isoform X2 [Aricia agestis]
MILGSERLSSKIISKYFTSKSGMDESLGDFQEKKIINAGSKKKKPSKCTIKKDRKLKGQKDIRALVKSRKNELLTYTKDFDQACKNSGLDVDSEQLQIAIALSKSLQDFGPQQDEVSNDIKPLTAKERSRKIKSTLQEYGFKVPNTAVQKTRRRVTNKNSKLLNTSECIKKEVINNKYLQILQRNPTPPVSGLVEYDQSGKEVYHKTTNILYSKIRTVDEFYVPNLIEKTTHRTSLLRDWSEIPGRPLSPVVEVNRFKFDEVLFSQEELDCILSHPLQEVQEIIKSKSMMICDEDRTINIEKTDKDMNLSIENEMNAETCGIINSKFNEKHTCIAQENRSNSPDLFDEDDYTPTIQFDEDQTQCSEVKCSSRSNKSSFMDLTECVGNTNNIQRTIHMDTKFLTVESSKILEDTNSKEIRPVVFVTQAESKNKVFEMSINSKASSSETLREINDFMEVTDCVASELDYNVIDNYGNKIHLKSLEEVVKQHLSKEDQAVKVNKNLQSPLAFSPSNSVDVEGIENIDLTQGSDNTILSSETIQNNVPISVDLTQSSNSNEDLPVVNISGSKEESLDATIILYDNDANTNIFNDKSHENIISSDVIYDKNKNQNNTSMFTTSNVNLVNKEHHKVCSDSIVFEVNGITGSPNKNISKDNNDISSMSNIDETIISEDNIDHTQRPELLCMSEDKIDLTQSPQSPNKTHSIESLGKQNNISIDYDELYDNMMTVSSDIRNKEDSLLDDSNDSIKLVEQVSDQSAILSNDNILNSTEEYHTVSNNIIEPPQTIEENNENDTTTYKSANEANMSICFNRRDSSFLPSVQVKKISKMKEIVKETNHTELSPIKISDVTNKSFGTPGNDQYIIKTQNVTPMLDYESMSTPARNKELEKYGIKPFKRKRAIQLLKYIYNQTHPVVEDCATDDMPSTSKKFKLDDQEAEQISDNTKVQISKETEERDADKENNLYMETKVNPDIKNIECCPDDWVFQTREKAKVHSCRVPLHIAFQNYVSCRHLLRTAILRYEPVNIDIIHKDLIASGYRYNPKELLKFLDKKCITVKTTENNARNRKQNKS